MSPDKTAEPRWEKIGQTHTLALEENGLFEIVICRADQNYPENSEWVVKVCGRFDTFLTMEDGTELRFKPADQMEETPGPEVFAAAMEYAAEIVQRLNVSLSDAKIRANFAPQGSVIVESKIE